MGSKTAASPLPCTRVCSPRAAQLYPLPRCSPVLPIGMVTPVSVAGVAGHTGTGELLGARAQAGIRQEGDGATSPRESAEPGHIPAPRTLAWLLGAELVPTVVPGCPAPRQRHSKSRRCWSTSLCRAGHPLAQPLTPQKARAETPPPAPQKGPLSLPVPHWRMAPLTCVCCEVPAVGLALVSFQGQGRRSLDLVQLPLLRRNRKPSADHTAIARFPVLPPLPASPPCLGLMPAHSAAIAGQPPAPLPLPAALNEGLALAGSGPAGAQGSSSPWLWSITPAEPGLSPIPTGVSPSKAPSAMPGPACPPAPLCAPASLRGCRD